jgi:hypothetical protein
MHRRGGEGCCKHTSHLYMASSNVPLDILCTVSSFLHTVICTGHNGYFHIGKQLASGGGQVTFKK